MIDREYFNLKEGINLSLYKTNKFKDINIYLNFLVEPNRLTNLTCTFLKYMLTDSCQKYKDKQSMSKISDLLYAGTIGTNLTRDVDYSSFEIHYNFIDPKYLSDISFIDYFEYIKETLFNPLFTNKKFDEFKKIIESIYLRELDKPNKLASNNFIKYLSKEDERISFIDNDYRDLLEEITLDDVINTYYQIINNSRLDIYVVGDVNNDIIDFFKDFDLKKRKNRIVEINKKEINSIGIKEDIIKANTSNLIVSYQMNYDPYSNSIAKWLTGITLLGISPTSLLFEEVREKNSLCYSIFPSQIRTNGLINIVTNISSENKDKTIKEIEKQINRVSNLDFEDCKLEEAKAYLISNVIQGYDDPDFLETFFYSRDIKNKQETIDEYVFNIRKINKNDIKDIFKDYRHILTYYLKGE